MIKFYEYPKCSTCKNAKKWLTENGVEIEAVDFVTNKLSVAEIKALHEISGLPIQKFFNTSGMKYRELGLSKVVKTAPVEELYEILASDGMLVKRPLVASDEKVTLGFKEATYLENWNWKIVEKN